MADLIPLRTKLAKCICLLNSNQDGEVAAAMEALKRTLKSCDSDLNDLADYIVEPQLTEEHMKKIYDCSDCSGAEAVGFKWSWRVRL